MKKNIEICPCCGHKIVEYRHKFNKVLLSDLKQLYAIGGKATLKEIYDRGQMNNSEYANFQKLQYFGLVVKDNDTYIITDKAIQFLKGADTCPAYAVTVNGKVIGLGPDICITEISVPVQDKEEWQEQATLF